MILYEGKICDLQAWHLWLPLIPITVPFRGMEGWYSERFYRWRWLYLVQRKNIYDSFSGKYMWTDYRDIRK